MGASYTLGRLAEALGATLVGDPDRLVTGVAPLDKAGRIVVRRDWNPYRTNQSET